jgi:protein O-GlcNAc transferase
LSSSINKKIRKAEKYIKINDYINAEALYMEILTKFPNNLKALHALKTLKILNPNQSISTHKNKRLQELNKHYNLQDFTTVIKKANELLKIYPKEANILIIQGASNAAINNFYEAIRCYEKILEIDPSSTIANYNIAVMYDSLELPKKAIEKYKETLKNRPDYVDAINNMGSAYKELGDFENALNAYNKVISLKPNHAFAHNNLGNIYATKQMPEKAIEAFKKAIFFDAKYADPLNNLGTAYKNVERFTDAYELWNRAISINPNHTKALLNIAFLHERNNDYRKSIPAYERAIQTDPNNIEIIAAKVSQQAHVCDFDKIKNDIPKIRNSGLKKEPINPVSLVPFDDAPERHQRRAEVYVKNQVFKNLEFDHQYPDKNSKRIRLGYVSSDFKNHPVSQLLARVIELHDKNNFKVFGYSLNPLRDEMTNRLEKAFDVYKEFALDLCDNEIISTIRQDKIDILIDLNGYTKNSKINIFAQKSAKIQINFLGFPATLGADFMDYIIADKVSIPKKYEIFYNENIIRLPHSYMPTDNTRMISNEPMTREEHGLPSEGIVFCCFNNNYKISSNEFDIWMRLLAKIGGSVLWLKINNSTARTNISIAAQKRGIDPKRIIFSDKLSMENHLARHSLADLFLDTFNFNAHTTACDALWAGLPIVTKIGKSFAARVAGSLLTAVGLEELITYSELEYEELIVKLASNPKELKRIKQKLEKNKLSEPLFNTLKYTSYLEKAYYEALENYSSKTESKNINISP